MDMLAFVAKTIGATARVGGRCPCRSAGGDFAGDERRTSRKHRQVNLWATVAAGIIGFCNI
jgi:hypothetical protein